jgi:preprotein translocase subunit YajC
VSGSDLGALLPLLLLVAAFVFLVLRPAHNRQRQQAALQNALSVGSEVMLTSGVFGRVTWLGEETLRVEIAPNMEIRVHRHAVGRVLDDEESVRMASERSDVSDDADSTPDTEASDAGDESDKAASDEKQAEKGD